MPINDFEDGVIVRFYVNDFLYDIHRVRSALRLNNGDLHLFPSCTKSSVLKQARIGNLAHYNYALSNLSVRDIYDAGPPRHLATDLAGASSLGHPLYLSEQNKLDNANS